MENNYRDYEYEAELKQRFQALLPKKVFDAHFHLSKEYALKFPEFDNAFSEWYHYMTDILGENRLTGGLMMIQPNKSALESEGNEFIFTQTHEGDGYVIALVVTPQCNREKIEKTLNENPKITTLKPYFNFSIAEDKFESDVLDFAPEWMWKLAHDRKMSILVHLSHYKKLLSDPANGSQLREMCLKYPDARLILAHCAMGHNPDKLKSGIKYIKDLDNVWFDCSGITEPAAICHLLDAFGPKKILYGGDHSFGANLGRICSFGSSFIGLHKGYLNIDKVPRDYKYVPMSNALEGLLALYVAGDEYGLDEQAWEDIFYNNAKWLFRIDDETNDAARDPEVFEKKIRSQNTTHITGAKGAELYYGLAPYYDTVQYIKDAPLGFANMEVMNAQKGALLSGYPSICTSELKMLLLKLNPWAKDVILTCSGLEAKEIANKLCPGKKIADRTGSNILIEHSTTCDAAVYGESMANGAFIGAVLLNEETAFNTANTSAYPSAVSVKAALVTLNMINTSELKNRIDTIIKRVRDIWQAAAAESGLDIKINTASPFPEFSFDDDVKRSAYCSEMKIEGFIADTIFYPSYAHTDQILDRFEKAVKRVFKSISKDG